MRRFIGWRYARRRRGTALLLRRLVRASVEDIGFADPQALVQAIAAKDMYDFLGRPEGEIPLSDRSLSGYCPEIECRLYSAGRRCALRKGTAR